MTGCRTRVKIFQLWDEDDSGFLDYREVDQAIHNTFAREMIAMIVGKGSLQDKFDSIDANNDSKISFEELFNIVRAAAPGRCWLYTFSGNPPTAAQNTEHANDRVAGIMTALDTGTEEEPRFRCYTRSPIEEISEPPRVPKVPSTTSLRTRTKVHT